MRGGVNIFKGLSNFEISLDCGLPILEDQRRKKKKEKKKQQIIENWQ